MSNYQRFRSRFAEALDPRLYPIEFLDALMASGRAECWASRKAAIVAAIKTFPTGAKAVIGIVAAGNLDAIERLIPQAEAWGKANGCTLAMIESRAGWAKRMKRHGYEPHQLTIIKDI